MCFSEEEHKYSTVNDESASDASDDGFQVLVAYLQMLFGKRV